jgi:hypothetical protein
MGPSPPNIKLFGFTFDSYTYVHRRVRVRKATTQKVVAPSVWKGYGNYTELFFAGRVFVFDDDLDQVDSFKNEENQDG